MDSLQGKLLSLLSKAYEELKHVRAEHKTSQQREHKTSQQRKLLNEAIPRPTALKTQRQEINNSAAPFPFLIAS